MGQPDAPLNAPMAVAPRAVGFAGVATADVATSSEIVGDGVSDDLKLLVGIGPVIEEILNDAGIHTFEQLADAGVDQLQDILPDLHDSRVEREDWLGQARRFAAAKAAGDDLEELSRNDQIT